MAKPQVTILSMEHNGTDAFFECLKVAKEELTAEQRREIKGELSDAYHVDWATFVAKAGEYFEVV